jgi:hypothetical protein
MKFYWTPNSFPELANVSQAERDRIWKRCESRARRHPAMWFFYAGFIVFMVLFNVGMNCADHLAAWYSITPKALDYARWFFFFLGILAFAQFRLQIPRRYIPAELPNHCRGCGYDLTGNVSGTCPECGTASV